jgi:hypothetical protein
MTQKKNISPILFAATLVCFLFPFVTVSCGGQRITSFNGTQLALGTTVDEPQMFGPSQKKKVDPEPLAAVALLCTVLGLGLSFLSGARAALGPAISGGVGALALLMLKIEDGSRRRSAGSWQDSVDLCGRVLSRTAPFNC